MIWWAPAYLGWGVVLASLGRKCAGYDQDDATFAAFIYPVVLGWAILADWLVSRD